MLRKTFAAAIGGAALTTVLSVSGPAQATLALTATGMNDGFVLSTVVSGYNFGGYGPRASCQAATLSPVASATERFTSSKTLTTRLSRAR
jgi:hypothetical protein